MMKETELKPCERCAFYDEDRDNQPCYSCFGQNFEEADMSREQQIDYKEYARQMRENCARDYNGNVICSRELWEEIATIIEGIEKQSEGEWVKHDSMLLTRQCSICKGWYTKVSILQQDYSYCPNCGARMSKGEKE